MSRQRVNVPCVNIGQEMRKRMAFLGELKVVEYVWILDWR